MQFRHSFLLFATLVVACLGEDADPKAPMPVPMPTPIPLPTPAARSGAAWLGFSVSKPDPAGAAQLPALPPGIGFVIQTVTPGGPAELAQLQPADVLWKFGDQMLVNKGQLATLLNLKSPGDEVTLAIFRNGKSTDVRVKLGEAPADRREVARDMIDATILSDDDVPKRIITILDRTATFSNNDGSALIRREGESYKVIITGADKTVVFDGTLPAEGSLDGIPTDWRRRICVLRRSLDHALESRMVPVRAPRPRVVPPPTPPPDVTPPPAVTSKH